MDILIQFLSDILGIPYDTVEGSIATVAFLFCIFLLRLLWDASKRDNKQVDLEQTLATLAVNAINSHAENTKLIKDISSVLSTLNMSFSKMILEVQNVAKEVKDIAESSNKDAPVLTHIKDNLLRTSTTTVLVKDVDDNVIAKFTAYPDDDGQLVVKFNPTVENKVYKPITDDLTKAASKAQERDSE